MKNTVRYAGLAVLGLVALLVVAVTAVYGTSQYRMNRSYAFTGGELVVPSDEATIERGHHLFVTRGCVDCHAHDLGGELIVDDPLAGRISGTNLTRGAGGVADRYTDAAWATAIRHGIRPDGKPLLFMPSYEYYPLSDEDVAALIAYIKSIDPVDRETPRHRVGPLGRALYLAGQMPLVSAEMIDHSAVRPPAPPEGATIEYGGYLATGCIGCHGPGYSGGRIPGTPPSFPIVTNITPDEETGIGRWTENDFFRALRDGVRPDGSELDPFMPVQNTRVMTDDEIRALWLYLQTVPPKPAGGR
jgi:mono/diheme cytochrome c family protein